MIMKEIVAYEGECFTIEWYFDENSESDAFEFFNALSESQQRKRVKAGQYYEK